MPVELFRRGGNKSCRRLFLPLLASGRCEPGLGGRPWETAGGKSSALAGGQGIGSALGLVPCPPGQGSLAGILPPDSEMGNH